MNFKFVPLLLLPYSAAFAAPENAEGLSKILAIQEAQISWLKNQFYFAEQESADPKYKLTNDWTPLPGLELNLDTTQSSSFVIRFDGSVGVLKAHIYCSFAIRYRHIESGVTTQSGQSAYGNQMVMGVPGNEWQTVSRSVRISDLKSGHYQISVLAKQSSASEAVGSDYGCLLDPSSPFSRFSLEARKILENHSPVKK